MKKRAIIIIMALAILVSPLGVGLAATATSGLSSAHVRIPAPKDIPQYKDIKKIGTAMYGVPKVAALAKKDLKTQLANEKTLKKFASVDELKRFMNKNIGTGQNNYYSRDVMAFAEAMPAAGLSKSADSVAMSGDFSSTNIQVAGVDEADLIKTDGRYAYALTEKEVLIIDAYPADKAEIKSRIVLRDQPQQIFINGQYLTVMGADQSIKTNPTYLKFRARNNFTFFKVFDVSDKANPKLVRDLSYEGDYHNSRMIGDYVYLLVANRVYNYFYSGDIAVPRAFNKGKEVRFCEGGLRCPPVYYFDLPYRSFNFMNVVAVNVKDNNQNPNNEVYLLSDGQEIFVSEKNLYITYPKYLDEDELVVEALSDLVLTRLPQEYQTVIKKINEVDEQVLSQSEKTQKILSIYNWYGNGLPEADHDKFSKELMAKVREKYKALASELEKTVIHKIAIDKEKITYKTAAEVNGQVLNQYSMDEKDGYFRIATTKNRSWSQFLEESEQESYSNLYVLDADLKPAGAVEKIAKGERIYSVRFMGDRAYMVTFQQVDPLFVIDLKDPRKPFIAGELKVPGFSNYLHPYDENTLIGLGKDTSDEEGRVRTGGIKLSLFDVNDITNPKEIDTLIMGESGSYSIAENEPKAFLFSREKSLLAIPVSIYEKKGGDYPQFAQNSSAVIKADKSGFTLRGYLDHSDGSIGESEYWWGRDYYDTSVKRNFYISDTLYTFSSRYLQANRLDNLEQIKRLPLENEKDYEIVN